MSKRKKKKKARHIAFNLFVCVVNLFERSIINILCLLSQLLIVSHIKNMFVGYAFALLKLKITGYEVTTVHL